MNQIKTLITITLLSLLFSLTASAFTYNPSATFNTDLKIGMTHNDVKDLQVFLNNNGFTVSDNGSGSIGKETKYFGKKTRQALIKFQETYKSDILEPLSLNNGTGLFYSSTRNFINNNSIKTPVITIFIPPTTSTSSVIVNIPVNSTTPIQQVTPTVISTPKTYTINYIAENGGTISGSSTQTIQENATGTEVTATADSGYYFIDWSDGITTVTRTDTNLTEDKTITANFGYRRRGSGVKAITTVEITGTSKVGEVVTAEILPVDATVTYQWQNATTSDGEYTDITDATSSTYTLTADNFGKYIKVIITGIGSYSGTLISNPTEIITWDVTFTYNGNEVTYGVVQNPTTTRIWLDRNLGATQVATAYNDELAYGDLFQWGRGDDGHQLRTSGTTGVLSETDTPGHANFIISTSDYNDDWRSPKNPNLWQGVDGINNPCPTGFRIPTSDELDSERTTWNSNDRTGAFDSVLKLTVSAYRFARDGSLYDNNYAGHCWSSTNNSPLGNDSNILYFDTNSYIKTSYNADGSAVRCIKD